MLLMATTPPALDDEFLRAATGFQLQLAGFQLQTAELQLQNAELQLQLAGFQLQTAELQLQRRPVRVDKWPSGGTWGSKQEHNTPLTGRSPAAAAEPATSRHLHPGYQQLDSAAIHEKKAHECAKCAHNGTAWRHATHSPKSRTRKRTELWSLLLLHAATMMTSRSARLSKESCTSPCTK